MDQSNGGTMGLIDGCWNDAREALSGIGSGDQSRLITAISAADAVWDRIIFDHAKTFAGPEVGDARMLSATIPRIDLFGIELPMANYGDFCGHLVDVSERYLAILEDAESLYLDIPTPVDAKSKEKASAPYLRLLDVIRSLRPAVRMMYQVTPGELALYAARHGVPTFADLTRVAKQHTQHETVERILDIMNDQGEEEEIDALYARHNPYEFRAANLGEVFALIAVHRTLMLQLPDRLDAAKPRLLGALAKYQAARAFLFAYEQVAEVPLKGERRHDPRNAQALLFRKKDAPSFGLLLRAHQEGGRE